MVLLRFLVRKTASLGQPFTFTVELWGDRGGLWHKFDVFLNSNSKTLSARVRLTYMLKVDGKQSIDIGLVRWFMGPLYEPERSTVQIQIRNQITNRSGNMQRGGA